MRETVLLHRPTILIEVLPGQEGLLKGVVTELWPGAYDWNPVDEGNEYVSRNVLLTPVEGSRNA
jgi:hypothetical protein